MFSPETIEAALFTLIETATANLGFKRVTRRAEMFSQTGPENQDAIFLVPDGAVIDQQQAYGVMRYRLQYMIVGRVHLSDDRAVVPQTRLNALWAAVDAATRPLPPGSKQTLGGLVNHAWIEGQVLFMGLPDRQQLEIAIPVTVETGI